jgi:hypothetical protein
MVFLFPNRHPYNPLRLRRIFFADEAMASVAVAVLLLLAASLAFRPHQWHCPTVELP